jgi:alpha-mannosidase
MNVIYHALHNSGTPSEPAVRTWIRTLKNVLSDDGALVRMERKNKRGEMSKKCFKGMSLLFAAMMAFTSAYGRAQDDKKLSLFSPAAQAKLERLSLLRKGLVDGPWKFHAGDVPHGEDPALDDSSWSVGQGKYETTDGSVWFRRTFVVPASLQGIDLRGSQIFFQFHAFAHGAMPEILYVNGRRIALGENLEPVELTATIVPGEEIHIAVKLLHTADVKHITPASYMLRLNPLRPNPIDIEAEIESAADLLQVVTPDESARAVQQKMLEDAANSVDIHALDSGDSAAFDTSLRKAQSLIEPLRPILQQASGQLIGNSHIDTAWLWSWTETVDVVRRTFSTALQLMPEYPQYKFSQSVALYSSWMQEKYPDIFEDMKQRTKEGRWEPVGGMWVEPDLNMPDGESLVRQLLIGKTFFRTQMGVDVRVGWNPDSFGYNWQLPQIYKRSGIDFFITQKLTWNETNQLPLKLFWWQSPDGSRVLTYFPQSYDQNTEPIGIAEDLANVAKLVPGDKSLLRLYGVGDHGGGPTRVMLDEADHWIKPDAVFPKLNYSTAISFFTDMQPKLDDASKAPVWNYQTLAEGKALLSPDKGSKLEIPAWNDELYLEFHRGVFTSQAAHKRNMRVSEENMLDAEKWASLAWLGGRPYPSDSLDEAWKKVLVNQFHDSAAGSSTAVVYKDAERDYESVRQTTSEVTAKSLDELAAHVDTHVTAGFVPLLVFNPLAWQRTDLVEAQVQLSGASVKSVELRTAEGKPVLSQVLDQDNSTGRFHILLRADNVPSLGYRMLYARPGSKESRTDLRANGSTLENSALRVVIDPATGCITHLIDKSSGFDSIAPGGCGNELQTFIDLPKKYDAWNIDADALDKMTPIRAADSVKLVEQGPLRAVVRIQRHWGHSTFTQDIMLYAGIDRVDVRNDFDWEETHVLLKAAFPLAAYSAKATYEIPFGTIDRPTTRDNLVNKAKFEVPALRWADLGDGKHGFSLLNDSKYGYDAAGNVLRLSLLRSPTYPDPNTDHGRQRFLYALYPHAGTWQQALTVRQGYGFNYGLTAMQVAAHNGMLGGRHSFLRVDGDNVVITAIKKAEESHDLVLRLFEWQGKSNDVSITLPGKPECAEEVGMIEDKVLGAIPLNDGKLSLSIKPYEIRTLRVHYEGSAELWDRTH